MPPLPKPRDERFANLIARGAYAATAYRECGWKGENRTGAHRKRKHPDIVKRVEEISRQMSEKTNVTTESLVEKLSNIAELSLERGQNSAAVNALALVAKLAGLIVDKKEVGKPGEFTEIERMSLEELDNYIREKSAKLADVIKLKAG